MNENPDIGRKRYGQKVYLVLIPDGLSGRGERVHDVKLTRRAAESVAQSLPQARTKLLVATK